MELAFNRSIHSLEDVLKWSQCIEYLAEQKLQVEDLSERSLKLYHRNLNIVYPKVPIRIELRLQRSISRIKQHYSVFTTRF